MQPKNCKLAIANYQSVKVSIKISDNAQIQPFGTSLLKVMLFRLTCWNGAGEEVVRYINEDEVWQIGHRLWNCAR